MNASSTIENTQEKGSLRPFLPAKDFSKSQEFYGSLGFKIDLITPGFALASMEDRGGISFFVQDFFARELAENLMLQWLVPDIEPWWQHLSSLRLEERFGVKPPKPPVREAWGTVAYLWDPSGVLWHLTALSKADADSGAAR